VAKMDIRTSGASIINTASSHLHCWAFRTPVNCQAIYGPSRKHHGLQINAADLLTLWWRPTRDRMDVPFAIRPRQCGRACLPSPRLRRCGAGRADASVRFLCANAVRRSSSPLRNGAPPAGAHGECAGNVAAARTRSALRPPLSPN